MKQSKGINFLGDVLLKEEKDRAVRRLSAMVVFAILILLICGALANR
jgi:hypothetical protein